VKAEVTARLDLWRRGFLDELALRAKVQARDRLTVQCSRTARATRRVNRLIHKQKLVHAASLAGSLGIADITPDTLEPLRHIFPKSANYPEAGLLNYYGPYAPPIPDT
jgi:hypothetical protein